MAANESGGIIREYFDLVAAGKFREGLKFFSADCKTHNPYVAGGMKELVDAQIAAAGNMASSASTASFKVSHLLVDGDMVAAHTELLFDKSDPGNGGLRQIHLFRFEDGKVAEYWDITQSVDASQPNAAGAF